MPLDNRTCFLVNLRDGLTCRRCGATPASRETYHRGFEYHHRRHRSDGGDDAPENVVLVCHACHRSHHDGKIDLGDLPTTPTPDRFGCRRCGRAVAARSVEMNCGWYRCAACHGRTHLFDHFGLEEELEDEAQET